MHSRLCIGVGSLLIACSHPMPVGIDDRSSKSADRHEGMTQVIAPLDVVHNASAPNAVTPFAQVFPGIPPAAVFGPNEYACTQSSPCACLQYAYLVDLDRPPAELIVSRLLSLSNLPMYGCYRSEPLTGLTDHNTVVPVVRGAEYRCKFLRRIQVTDVTLGELLEQAMAPRPPRDAIVQAEYAARTNSSFPGSLARELQKLPLDIALTAVFAEADVHVDSNGIPMEEATSVRPVLLQTRNRMFSVLERHYPNYIQECSQDLVYRGAVVNMKACAPLCTSQVMRELPSAINQSISSGRLAALRRTDNTNTDGEMWFGRVRKASKVIGRNQFEISNYVISGKLSGSVDDLKRMAPPFDSGSLSEAEVMMYIKASATVNIASNIDGPYAEPSPQEREQYHDVLKQAIQYAVASVCVKLHGVLVDEVCVLPSPVK